MGTYQNLYKQKLTSVEDALSHIKSGDVIGASLCAMEPVSLLSRLHTLRGKVENVTIMRGLEMVKYPFMTDADYADTFRCESLFLMGPGRESMRQGITSFAPTHLHNVLARRRGYRYPNVVLISAAPMDEHGYFRCSLCQIWEAELLEHCDLVIMEVNPNMPLIGGDTAIHISRVHHLVETNTPVPKLPRSPINEVDQVIGEYIATLVNDGDTIQLGIGGIPNAVGKALMSKRDLGLHIEMLTNSISDLVEAGVLTGRKKNLHNGKMIATFALGDQKLYDMMHNNPAVEILRGDYVNAPFVIAKNDNMVSINTCISVDLSGQVNSESIGSLQYSGSGGQVDTACGAIHAKNGRSIIALNATAKDGTVSTIMSSLAPGAIVTLSRNNVDYVVTEYGIASLRGRSVRDRVSNLIAIAHPHFRVDLKKQAEALMLW